ncbi:MAG TPA: L,D-transpeptidase family protein [Legionellaceae bacterium]|nr:L,D-transpeptidase family protein [Legionellaceae bacterium]
MRHIYLIVLLCFISTVFGMSGHIDASAAIDHAIMRYGLQKEPHLMSYFMKSGVAYPPKEIALLAFKKEQHIQLWAKDAHRDWHYIHTYPLTAFSGKLGPKLKEHDRQIPEGIYRLITFNPHSSMHLSMMINYPNEFDRYQAQKDGRRKLGGDIFLHGKAVSVGCLAVGDHAIDELFLLTRRVGLNHVQLIIAPNDLRKGKPATNQAFQPRWLPQLYHKISQALTRFPLAKSKHTA